MHHRNERYFGKNDGKHNFYGQYENLDDIIDHFSETSSNNEENNNTSENQQDD